MIYTPLLTKPTKCLNILWTPLFFGLRMPRVAFVEIVVLCFAVMDTMQRFKKVDAMAYYLLVPYLMWITFASMLNGSIAVMN